MHSGGCTGPVGAWLAVSGAWPSKAVILGLAVGVRIGGFDLVHACQDVETDRRAGVRSVPARSGIPAAIRGARLSHPHDGPARVFAAATHAGAFSWLGLLIVAGAFFHEHSVVRPHGLSRLDRALFQVNGFIGIALIVCVLLDLVVRALSLG